MVPWRCVGDEAVRGGFDPVEDGRLLPLACADGLMPCPPLTASSLTDGGDRIADDEWGFSARGPGQPGTESQLELASRGSSQRNEFTMPQPSRSEGVNWPASVLSSPQPTMTLGGVGSRLTHRAPAVARRWSPQSFSTLARSENRQGPREACAYGASRHPPASGPPRRPDWL